MWLQNLVFFSRKSLNLCQMFHGPQTLINEVMYCPKHWYRTQNDTKTVDVLYSPLFGDSKTIHYTYRLANRHIGRKTHWAGEFPICRAKTRMFAHVHTPSKSCKLRGWGGGAAAEGGANGVQRDGQRGRSREEQVERRRGKGYTISAGGSELPGNVTMSSPWEHRACRLFWTNRQLSRQW